MTSPVPVLPTSPSSRACRFAPCSASVHQRRRLPLTTSPPRLSRQATDSRRFSRASPFLQTHAKKRARAPLTVNALVGNTQFVMESETSVKFEKVLTVPGCATPMVLVGTGYREKVFAIIGVKVYAAGFYAETSLSEILISQKGRTVAEVSGDGPFFKCIFEASFKKSLKIVLVRDIDGKIFWNALNDVISPRIKELTASDETAIRTFRTTFENRSLTKGTAICLTWDEPSKMLVSISPKGIPSAVDAVIQSTNVTFALFDAFFCDNPVSPTLKASVADGLVALANTL